VDTKNVAPYRVVAGVPARPVQQRFEQAQFDALENIAFWDWEHEKLRNTLKDFRVLSIDAFIQKHLAAA